MLPIYARREQEKIDRSIFEVHRFLSTWSSRQGSAFSIALAGKVLE